MRPTRACVATLAAACALAPVGVRGQTELALELGGSQAGPATGFDSGDARFAMGGLRWSTYVPGGSGVYASLLGGQVLGDSTGGSFFSGLVEGSLRDRWSTRWTGGLDLKILGFGVGEPFPYRTLAAELHPSILYRATRASITLGALAGVGRSRVELGRTPRGLVVGLEDDLWRLGTTGEILVGSSTVQVGIAGSAHQSSGEAYSSLGARVVFGGAWGVVELRADRWSTPLGWETTGGVSLGVPFGGRFSVRAFVGRSDPDPLVLAQPGSGSGGALLGWSFYSTAPVLAPRDALYEVIAYTDTGGRVRLAVEAPEGASQVQLLGDFTLWDPIAMRREGDRWVVEVDVPAGTHHYGFLADDEWYVPDDAPDVVPDEWGRETATLVIEGAGR